MRKSFAAIGTLVALGGGMVAFPAFASSSPAVSPVPASVQQQTATPVRKTERREAHPEIRKAIAALERAKTDLRRANHDFGGHRADALAACDKAIEQLKLALQYDKR
ncbi:MAG: hypothetical protein ABI408_04375 [Gemmatimonadaceae bacterium]